MADREDDLTEELFEKIASYIYQQARINLGKNKMELVRARFGKVMRQRGISSYREYFQWMQSDTTGVALREVMNAISTNLTSFFRENEHFVFLSKTLLPELEKKGGRASHKIRLRGWSAGCSTGEEVYSMGITILETLSRPEGWDIKLLATDLDTEVVAHGQRGVYGKDRVQGIQAGIVNKYFNSVVDGAGKAGYQVKDLLHNLVTFRHLNLFSAWPFRYKFDFIFCRNVMIYFDRPTQESLINRFYDALHVGGYLFIGHSESLSGVNHRFEYVKPTIYQKK